MERDLTGRCGSCAFFMRFKTDDAGVSSGDCRLIRYPLPRLDTNTCSSYKAIGASWDAWGKKKPAAGTPRALREREEGPPPEKPLPKEIDIDMDQDEFRRVLRQVIREELGVAPTQMGDRWRGGEVVIQPGKKDTQEKRVPIDQFFHKIVMVRDKLRVLEQKINGNDKLSADEKIALQQYITGCYGSLTTFNVLFRDREDGFQGAGGKD